MNAKEAREYAEDMMFKHCIDKIKTVCEHGGYMITFHRSSADHHCQTRMMDLGYKITENISEATVVVRW